MELRNSIKTFNICTTRVIVEAELGKANRLWSETPKNNEKIMQLPWNTSNHVHRHNYTLVTALYVGDKILPTLMVNLLGTNKIHTNDQMISQFARSSQMWFVSAEYVSRFIGAADVRRYNFFFHCTWYHRRGWRSHLNEWILKYWLGVRPHGKEVQFIASHNYQVNLYISVAIFCCHNFYDSLSHISRCLWSTWPYLRCRFIFDGPSDKKGSKMNWHRSFCT